ncbi:ATP-binding protein [Streptomyces nojiriensis]
MFGEYSVNDNQAGSAGGDPAPAPATTAGNLPPGPSGFVGRERELTLLRELLEERRLITLTGVGGVGKSRLALRAVSEAAAPRPDGVWWVELSPLRDPGLLTTTISHAVGLADHSSGSLDEELCAWMADKRLLLVLDTCEHLVAECRHLVGELLQSAPGLTVVVTSREPLGSPGEEVVEVRPLPCEGPDSDALALFRARALAATPQAAAVFADPARTAVAVEVCRRLDGIPLALELAGARMRLWTLEEMAERLGERLSLLSDTRAPSYPGTRRCGPPSAGATSCASHSNGCCGPGCPCSRGTSTSRPPARCARAARCPPRAWSAYWRAWSPSRWCCAARSAVRGPATGCWTRSASTATTGWSSSARCRSSPTGTPTGTRPSPRPPTAAGWARARSTGTAG